MLALLMLAVLLAGCRPYGPGVPVCGELELTGRGEGRHLRIEQTSGESTAIRSAHVIQVQAVPTTEWGLCLDDPPSGWMYAMPEPVSGEFGVVFVSGGPGSRFLTATLTETCDVPAAARREDSPREGIDRFVQVHDPGPRVAVVVISVAPRHDSAAFLLAEDLGQRSLRGNPIRTRFSPAALGSVAERVEAALAAGDAVVVVDDPFLLDGELELRLPGEPRPFEGGLGTMLAELGDRVEPPAYEATWWHVTDGGCITYEFDASGPGAGTVVADAERALGFFPVGELRRALIELGYPLDAGS